MVNGQENGLKGQHNLAQGKRSDTQGWKADRKIVRPVRQGLSGGAITFIKEKILFRTRLMTLCFPEMMSGNFLPAAATVYPQICYFSLYDG